MTWKWNKQKKWNNRTKKKKKGTWVLRETPPPKDTQETSSDIFHSTFSFIYTIQKVKRKLKSNCQNRTRETRRFNRKNGGLWPVTSGPYVYQLGFSHLCTCLDDDWLKASQLNDRLVHLLCLYHMLLKINIDLGNVHMASWTPSCKFILKW